MRIGSVSGVIRPPKKTLRRDRGGRRWAWARDRLLPPPSCTAVTNVAVVEKGYLGGGNTGRNTTIVRSNYLWDEAAHLYEHAMKLWEGLSQDLNYNVMFSQRGVLKLRAHFTGYA